MKAVLVQPKNRSEMDLVQLLLNKLGVASRLLSDEEMEDIGLGILMKNTDRSKKVSKESVLKKLGSK